MGSIAANLKLYRTPLCRYRRSIIEHLDYGMTENSRESEWPSDYNLRLGARITARRNAVNLPIGDLARAIGIRFPDLRLAEKGYPTVDPRLILAAITRLPATPPDEKPWLSGREIRNVWSALSRMRPRHREVWLLFHIDQIPLVEIAARRGTKLATASSTLQSAERALEHYVTDLAADPRPNMTQSDPESNVFKQKLPVLNRAAMAERLKVFRERNSTLTQAGLARALGLPLRTYQSYEHGQAVLSAQACANINHVLGLRIEWLLTGHGPAKELLADDDVLYESVILKVQAEVERLGLELDQAKTFRLVRLAQRRLSDGLEPLDSNYLTDLVALLK